MERARLIFSSLVRAPSEDDGRGGAQGPHSLRSRKRVSRHGDRMRGSASKRVHEIPNRPTLAITLSLVYLPHAIARVKGRLLQSSIVRNKDHKQCNVYKLTS
jgi:hypothetical protein